MHDFHKEAQINYLTDGHLSFHKLEIFLKGWISIGYSLGFPDSSVSKESTCNAGDPLLDSWVGKICWRRDRLPTPVFLGFPCGSVKNPPAMQETWVWSLVGKIPWRRESLPTPVFWLREFHGLYSPWGHKESDRLSDFHLHLIECRRRIW